MDKNGILLIDILSNTVDVDAGLLVKLKFTASIKQHKNYVRQGLYKLFSLFSFSGEEDDEGGDEGGNEVGVHDVGNGNYVTNSEEDKWRESRGDKQGPRGEGQAGQQGHGEGARQ